MSEQLIVMHALGRGRFRVEWNGDALLQSSGDPEFEACRALNALGISGTLRTRHAGAAHDAMRVNIEIGAGLAAVEGTRRGPRIVRYVPFGGVAGCGDSVARTPAILFGVPFGEPKNETGRQRATADTGNEELNGQEVPA